MDIEVYKVDESKETEARSFIMEVNHSRLLGAIFAQWYHHIAYMSANQIMENIDKSIELAKETFEWKKNGSLQKKIRTMEDYIAKYTCDKKTLMVVVMNTILSTEGLSSLKGKK